MPSLKLVVILRNPVQRAFDNFHLICASLTPSKCTPQQFHALLIAALKPVLTLDEPQENVVLRSLNASSSFSSCAAIIRGGFYCTQLDKWFNSYRTNTALIIAAEELSTTRAENGDMVPTAATFEHILSTLDLDLKLAPFLTSGHRTTTVGHAPREAMLVSILLDVYRQT